MKDEKLALGKYRQVICQGRVINSRFTGDKLRSQGRYPLTLEEFGLLLAALGFDYTTRLDLTSLKLSISNRTAPPTPVLFGLLLMLWGYEDDDVEISLSTDFLRRVSCQNISVALFTAVNLCKCFGTEYVVNLCCEDGKHGAMDNDTTETSTSGCGSLILEMGALSRLAGDPRFEIATLRALRKLWSMRSSLNILGTTLDIASGEWIS